jgi:hypothetical protein
MSLTRLLLSSEARKPCRRTDEWNGHSEITSPEKRFSTLNRGKGVLEVKNASTFYNTQDVYIRGFVCEGSISKGMTATLNGSEVEIVSIDCKFGEDVECVGSGYNVLLTARGVSAGIIRERPLIEFSEDTAE